MNDFFEQSNKNIKKLNLSEQKIFDYVVKNNHKVKDMSIRQLAGECFVATTTILRFVKKLGFEGYSDFSISLKQTGVTLNNHYIPDVLWKRTYSEEYLKNIIESVRVVSQEQLLEFNRWLDQNPVIYFFGNGLSKDIARYAYHIFTSMGVLSAFPVEKYELNAAINQIRDQDVAFIFSYTGENDVAIKTIEMIKTNKKTKIISITKAGNNIIQNMSDLNFYVFADEMKYNGIDLTSRVSMIAIVEMLAYGRLMPKNVTPYTKM